MPFTSDEDGGPTEARVCEPKDPDPPCARGAEVGRPYEFDLLTHCGVEWAYLDGRYWVPAAAVDTPSDWAGVERGTMTLVRRDRAVFAGPSGPDIHFVPARASYRPPPCA